MHEYHIMEKIVKTAQDSARANNASKVHAVSLVVGRLTGFEENCIRLYFENLTKSTMLEGAQLKIRHVEGKLKCQTCDTHFDYKEQGFSCPRCGKELAPTEIGKEFYIENIEIESA